MDAQESLAGLLKRHRTTAGLTQEELAERAEVSARTISDTERGLRSSIYKDTTKRIADALGLQGDEREAFEQAARGRRSTRQPPPTLPLPPTTLIGRDAEVARVVDALDTGVRLISLSGPGGIGKTRIALDVARIALTRFDGRVFFVELGAIDDPGLVRSAIARAVGVTWAPTDIIAAIVEQLRHQDSLLVLDTFEHVLDAASDVAKILAGASDVRVITTTREVLRLRGEEEIAVSPLAREQDAVSMFIERARSAGAEISLDIHLETIAAICRKLDGVPLAIELAAARTKHLPLPVLLEQLEHRLDVLTRGARDLPERQRTMRDTVAWSEGLLDEDQRTLFRQLSVFAGGWTLTAATQVCVAADDITALLSALIDKSLVVRVSDDDEARYRMLDVIREFAGEARGEDREIASRHASFFLTLAQQLESALGSADQDRWFRRVAADQDNVRAAHRWVIDAGDAEGALRFAGALWQFWRAHGDVAEGREWLQRSLALNGGSVPSRGKALWGAAWLAYHQDDYDAASTYGEELAKLATTTEDLIVRRNALTVPGIVAMAQGRYEDARVLFEQAVDVLRPIGHNWLFATSLLNLGSSCVRADPSAARAHLEEARALYERVGDRSFSERASIQIAFSSMAESNFVEARDLIAAALLTVTELDDVWGIAESLEAMSAVEAADNRVEDAALLTGAARAIRSTMAVRQHPFDAAWIDRYVDRARRSVDRSTWQRWVDEGATMEFDRVIEVASRSRSQATKR